MSVLQITNVTVVWNSTVTVTDSRDKCLLTSSSDGAGDVISPETELLISKLKSAVLIPLIYTFGGPANIINIIVFFKQGIKDRVNLCLFSLAVVDLLTTSFCFLVYMEQMFMFTSLDTHGPIFAFFTNNKIMLFYSSLYGSMFLSAIIALERCICVTFPLHAKTLLKTKNMAAIIIIGVPTVSFIRLVVMAKYEVVCFFDKRKDVKYMGLYVTEYQERNKELLDIVDVIVYGFVIAVGSPCIVLIATVVTSVVLWQTAAWRRQTSSASSRTESAVTKMLILLSAQFLMFTIPVVFLRIYPLFNTDFSPRGKHRLFFLAFSNISEVFGQMAMSFSFIVYYFASSRYRQTFHALFKRKCFCKKSRKL